MRGNSYGFVALKEVIMQKKEVENAWGSSNNS